MDEQTIIPKATLWIGKEAACYTEIVHFLRTIYCKTACSLCSICSMIQQKEYYNVYWMNAEQSSTREDFLHIEQIVSYKRDEELPLFFVIPSVDFLSKSCANSVLKVLEGSEKNYFFLLTAQRKNTVIPTIVSRCFVRYAQTDKLEDGLLYALFSKSEVPEYGVFMQLVEQYKVKQEREILAEYNDLLSFWLQEYTCCKDEKEKKRIAQKIDFIQQCIMSGIPFGSFPFMARTLYLRWVE